MSATVVIALLNSSNANFRRWISIPNPRSTMKKVSRLFLWHCIWKDWGDDQKHEILEHQTCFRFKISKPECRLVHCAFVTDRSYSFMQILKSKVSDTTKQLQSSLFETFVSICFNELQFFLYTPKFINKALSGNFNTFFHIFLCTKQDYVAPVNTLPFNDVCARMWHFPQGNIFLLVLTVS